MEAPEDSPANQSRVDRRKCLDHIALQIGLQRRRCAHAIFPLRFPPALLYGIQLTVKFRQEKHLASARLALRLQKALDVTKVRLVV